MKPKYINPFTDYGFKKLFGEEASKKLLISFLNDLLPIRDKIINLTFKKNEQQGDIVISRKAVYDIFCEDEKGSQFIVEMQNAKQLYFKDRAIYYSTFPIRDQAQ
ncbi:PD-(D/E)XK nuclease family transposase [Clostridium sp.]|uniref:PD-(D/E)XK nuclease family transposase n=1 Tax=Clostridium sp. TaxID=1506 RepID=UPI00284BCC27|nr:PD-(D/E)XK nuclease family transposase [Clostridium sp.]MDR3594802.1 PD-(D/E)XK nuclease family transposase [Clostridium sp.]